MRHPREARNPARRRALRRIASHAVAAFALGELPLLNQPAYAEAANDWPEQAFSQKSEADVLRALYGKTAEPSGKIDLDAPDIAENGAVVPISVTSSLPKVTSIAILLLNNPNTLAANYLIGEGTLPEVASRLKVAKTGNVVAIVESDGKLYSATKTVKVTVGGCGG